MSNSDMPASPTIHIPTKENGGYYKNDDTAVTKHQGLTKREAFAMAAMQGELASQLNNNSPDDWYSSDRRMNDHKKLAKRCVTFADALLKELDKEK